MAAIKKQPNGRFHVTWVEYIGIDPDTGTRRRKQGKRSFEKISDARAFKAEVEVRLASGRAPELSTTMSDYLRRWLPAQPWRESTRASAESQIRNHIEPTFGDVQLRHIRSTDVQRFVTDLTDIAGLAPRTVEAVYVRLTSILNSAVADKVIAETPAVRIQLPKPAPRVEGDIVTLTPDQVRALAEAVPPWLRAFVLTAAWTGMRSAEIAGLTTERLDLDAGIITIDRQLVTPQFEGGEIKLGPPKTAASVRTIAMPAKLVEALRQHMAEFEPVVLDVGATLIFTNRDGRPLRRNTLGDNFAAARTKMKLGREVRGWHVLRHTYASTLIRAGVDTRTVMNNLGHSSITETVDTYGHLLPGGLEDAANAVEQFG